MKVIKKQYMTNTVGQLIKALSEFDENTTLECEFGPVVKVSSLHDCETNDLSYIQIEGLDDENEIECWSCKEEMTSAERSENDGHCIHCQCEIQIGEVV